MPQVTSKDGTTIAYDKSGNGPAIIIINRALGFRDYYGDRELANELSKEFTVIIYDRRGRGESTDTLPYAVDREIEDIEALIAVAGGKTCLYGISSGAVLALKATINLGNKVTKLAIYEPPWAANVSKEEFGKEFLQLKQLLAASRRGDAVALFLSNSLTPQMIEDLRSKADEWKILEAVAPTILYDYIIMGTGLTPIEAAKLVTVPTLVLNGSEGLTFINDALEKIVQALPRGQRQTLKGQTHAPSGKVLAPVLTAFFKS